MLAQVDQRAGLVLQVPLPFVVRQAAPAEREQDRLAVELQVLGATEPMLAEPGDVASGVGETVARGEAAGGDEFRDRLLLVADREFEPGSAGDLGEPGGVPMVPRHNPDNPLARTNRR